MYLYLDTTSTTGVWLWKSRMDDPMQPHMIRVAAALFDNGSNEARDTYCALIRPEPGWPSIPPDGFERHGIGNDDLQQSDTSTRTALSRLTGMIGAADTIIMQNMQFHQRMLWRAYHDMNQPLPELPRTICTMIEAKIAMRSAKWISLAEGYQFFMKEPLFLPADPQQRGLIIVAAVRAVHVGIMKTNPERAIGSVLP